MRLNETVARKSHCVSSSQGQEKGFTEHAFENRLAGDVVTQEQFLPKGLGLRPDGDIGLRAYPDEYGIARSERCGSPYVVLLQFSIGHAEKDVVGGSSLRRVRHCLTDGLESGGKVCTSPSLIQSQRPVGERLVRALDSRRGPVEGPYLVSQFILRSRFPSAPFEGPAQLSHGPPEGLCLLACHAQ